MDLLTALAHNDNGLAEAGRGPLTDRQRLALLAPVGAAGVPSAAQRRRHEVGVAVLTSTVVVERGRGPLRWRVSVTVWEGAVGRHAAQVDAVARQLARRLLDGVGEGDCLVERSGATFFARRLLSGSEAQVVAVFGRPAELEGGLAATAASSGPFPAGS